MSEELPFLLQEGENLVKDAALMLYFGVGIMNIGYAGGGISSLGLGGGVITSKQYKREKSVFDSTPCHVYLTNNRIVFVKAKLTITFTKEKSLENIFSDIPLESIEGLYPGTKFKQHATIDLSVRSPKGEMDTISVAFLDQAAGMGLKRYKRAPERDNFINALEEQRKKLISAKKIPADLSSKKSDEDPLRLLKVRFAKGEITKDEYEEMKSLLES